MGYFHRGYLTTTAARVVRCFKNQQPDGSGGAIHCCVLHPNQAEVLCGDASGRVAVWDLTANRVRYGVADHHRL